MKTLQPAQHTQLAVSLHDGFARDPYTEKTSRLTCKNNEAASEGGLIKYDRLKIPAPKTAAP